MQTPSAMRQGWLALLCLLVTTVASAPVFMSGLYLTPGEPMLSEAFETVDESHFGSPAEPPPVDLLAFVSIPPSLELLAEVPEPLPLDPIALGLLSSTQSGHGAGQGSSEAANAYHGFADGTPVGAYAALPVVTPINKQPIITHAISTVGGAAGSHAGANSPTAIASGGAPGAIGRAAAPRLLKKSAVGPASASVSKSSRRARPRTTVPTSLLLPVSG
jgi:hypothetical protein